MHLGHAWTRMEQARATAQLAALQASLEAKEAAFTRLTGGREVSELKTHYHRVLSDLQAERDALARDRVQLVQVVHM